MGMKHLAGLCAGAAVVVACVPERDNPNDVSNRPHARLEVVVREADGACAPVDSRAPGEWQAVEAASRGACLGLDARASFDPQGEVVTHRFFYSTGGTATFDIAPAPEDDPGVVTLDVDWVRDTLPPRRGIQFGVRVFAGGGTDEVSLPFYLLNEAPTAVVPPPTLLAAGGLPWAPGEAYSVTFRPGATDPDDDPAVEYCWTIETAGTRVSHCSEDPSDPAFTQAIPATQARFVATLTVSDGDLVSEPASTYVLVSPSVTLARDDVDGFYALDPLPPLPVLASLAGQIIDYAQGDERVFLAIAHYAEYRVQLRDAVSGDILDEVTLTGSFLGGAPAYDPIARRVWVAGIADDASGRAIMRSYSTVGDLFAPELADFDLGFTANNVPSLTTIADGSVYVVGPYVGGEQHVVRVRALETAPFYEVEQVLVTDECCFGDPAGLPGVPSARPGHAETWIPQQTVGNTPSFLARFAAGEEPQLFSAQEFKITAIAWSTSSQLWALADNQGALLLDADALVSGVPLTDSIVVHHPEVTTGRWIECDPSTRNCIAGGASESWRFDGTRIEHQSGMVPNAAFPSTPFRGQYLDGLGAIWGNGPQRILATRPDRVMHEFHRLADTAVHDPYTGGVWISAGGPLLRIAADGTLVRIVSTASRDGVVGPIDAYYALLPEPGGALWGVESVTGTLVRIDDPKAEIPTIRTINASSIGDMSYFVPVRTSTGPAAWHTHADYPDQVALLRTTGTVTFVFAVPEAAQTMMAAASPIGGALCHATSTATTTPSTIHLRRITTAGAVADFGAIASADPVTAVAYSRAASGGDVCWMASANPLPGVAAAGCAAGREGRIRAWRSTGALLVDECVSGKVTSIRATNENEVQLTWTKGGVETLVFATRPSGTLVFHEFPTPQGAPLRFLD